MNFHLWICETETRLRKLESYCPEKTWAEYTLLLSHAQFLPAPQSLQIKPVKTAKDWLNLIALRQKIEIPFGLTDPKVIQQLISDIQTKCQTLNGIYFIAEVEDQQVGEIGIFSFSQKGFKMGRLQDIDILPEFQGKGYGTQLIQAICAYALQNQYQALGLMALINDWPQRWYQKLGFKIQGVTSSAPG